MQCPFCYKENLHGAIQCQHCAAVLEGPGGRAIPPGRAVPPGMVPNTSGQGKASVVPDEIRKWNWGAFLMGVIWGVGNRTYIAFLAVVPLFGFVMMIILGVKGSEWAWRNKRWESVEHFKRVQSKWAWWGFGVQVVLFILLVLSKA